MSSSLIASNVDGRSQIGAYYPGSVTKVHKAGTFDVHYDGGGREKKVERKRIKLETEPDWELVYEGKELAYAVEASVPDVILEREEGVMVEMQFCMQTLGTEYPIEEPSLHSLQVTFSTVNHDIAVASFMDTLSKSKAGSSLSEESDAVSRNKKKIKEAIMIDGHLLESWHKGKVVEGAGYGKHFV